MLKRKNSVNEKTLAEYWDCRETAKNYVTGSSLLAGFAFASIILLLDNEYISTTDQLLKDRTCTAFLLSFFGCLISTFNYSIISGEGKITSRIYGSMLICGLNFTLSASLLFWGLISFFRIYSADGLIQLAIIIFSIVIVFAISYLNLLILDINHLFTPNNKLSKSKLLFFLGYPIVIVLVGAILPLLFPHTTQIITNYFKIISTILLILITVTGGLAIYIGQLEENYVLPKGKSFILIGIQAILYFFLLLLAY